MQSMKIAVNLKLIDERLEELGIKEQTVAERLFMAENTWRNKKNAKSEFLATELFLVAYITGVKLEDLIIDLDEDI